MTLPSQPDAHAVPRPTGTVAVRPVLLPVAAAALAGLLLIFGAGFAQPHVVHNAAHDTRHAVGFPCH